MALLRSSPLRPPRRALTRGDADLRAGRSRGGTPTSAQGAHEGRPRGSPFLRPDHLGARASRPHRQVVFPYSAFAIISTATSAQGAHEGERRPPRRLSRVEFLGEMSDVLHSRAPLPLIPSTFFFHKGLKGGGFRAISGIGTGHRYAWLRCHLFWARAPGATTSGPNNGLAPATSAGADLPPAGAG